MNLTPATPTERVYSLFEAKESFFGHQSVEAAVSLTSLTHETSEGDDALLTSHLAVFVDLNNARSD